VANHLRICAWCCEAHLSMELTFVHQYSGDSPKRRRLAKACESCRTRKVYLGPKAAIPTDKD